MTRTRTRTRASHTSISVMLVFVSLRSGCRLCVSMLCAAPRIRVEWPLQLFPTGHCDFGGTQRDARTRRMRVTSPYVYECNVYVLTDIYVVPVVVCVCCVSECCGIPVAIGTANLERERGARRARADNTQHTQQHKQQKKKEKESGNQV